MMKTTLVLCATTLVLFACQSADERCNQARVAAHDAWAAYVSLAEADAADAQAAFSRLDTANRPARDQACRAAWQAYVTELSTVDPDGDDALPHYGASGIVIAALSVQPAQATDPCAGLRDGTHTDQHGDEYWAVTVALSRIDPQTDTYRDIERRLLHPGAIDAAEAAAVASGEIPQTLVDQRDAAIRTATGTYETAVGAARERQAWTATQIATARAALSLSTSGAVVARDAARAVPDDPGHPERAAAHDRAEASWEACQSVDP